MDINNYLSNNKASVRALPDFKADAVFLQNSNVHTSSDQIFVRKIGKLTNNGHHITSFVGKIGDVYTSCDHFWQEN